MIRSARRSSTHRRGLSGKVSSPFSSAIKKLHFPAAEARKSPTCSPPRGSRRSSTGNTTKVLLQTHSPDEVWRRIQWLKHTLTYTRTCPGAIGHCDVTCCCGAAGFTSCSTALTHTSPVRVRRMTDLSLTGELINTTWNPWNSALICHFRSGA